MVRVSYYDENCYPEPFKIVCCKYIILNGGKLCCMDKDDCEIEAIDIEKLESIY